MIGWSAALLLALSPLSALAQSETGTRLGGRPAQMPSVTSGSNAERARVWLERYAACLSRRDPKRVAAVLDAKLEETSGVLAKLSQGYYDDCLSGGYDINELRMSHNVLVGALYADRVSSSVRQLTAAMVQSKAPLATAMATADAAAAARLSMLDFGECVIRSDPEHALSYVKAAAGTELENKALAALRPALGPCVDTGSKIKMSRSIIEAALAEAIYRTMRAPVTAAVQTTDKK